MVGRRNKRLDLANDVFMNAELVIMVVSFEGRKSN
jgi:hypothetical protein